MLSLLLISAAGGFLTVLSPCVLPVLPGLLAGSASGPGRSADRWRPAIVVAGLAMSFLGVGIIFTIAGVGLGGSFPDLLRWVGVAALAVFGVLLLSPELTNRFFGRLSAFAPKNTSGRWGAVMLGASLGLVWAPCAGPILGFILTLAIAQGDAATGSILLASYTLGAALPMLAIGYGGRAIFTRLRGTSILAGDRLKKALGVMLLIAALAIATGLDRRLLSVIPSLLPPVVEQSLFEAAGGAGG